MKPPKPTAMTFIVMPLALLTLATHPAFGSALVFVVAGVATIVMWARWWASCRV